MTEETLEQELENALKDVEQYYKEGVAGGNGNPLAFALYKAWMKYERRKRPRGNYYERYEHH